MSNSFVYGKTALVIGGTSGIGGCVANILAEKCADVYVTGTHAPECEKLHFIPCDFERNGLAELERLEFVMSECTILCVCYGPFVQKSKNLDMK